MTKKHIFLLFGISAFLFTTSLAAFFLYPDEIKTVLPEIIFEVPEKTAPDFSFRTKQKVSVSSDLTFSFPDVVDKKSAESFFVMPEGVEGTIRWKDDRTMVFHPETSLIEEELYVFSFEKQTIMADGTMLGKMMQSTFLISSDPLLSTHIPASDSEEVPLETKITLVFDRLVVPLTMVHAKKNPEYWPVTITPEISGRWRWLGTTTVTFVPDESLIPATKYVVSIPAGVSFASGEKTTEDFSFSFSTLRPEVVSMDPRSSQKGLGPDTKITLDFTLPVDLESVREKLVFTKEGEETPVDIRGLSYAKKEQSEDEKKKKTPEVFDTKSVVFQSSKPLSLNTKYLVTVMEGLKGVEGNLASAKTFTSSFKTDGPMFVERGEFQYNSISLRFSNSLKETPLKQKISISPKVEGWKDLEIKPSRWGEGRGIDLYPQLKASTTYTLSVDQNVLDSWGQNLPEKYVLKFTTDPVDSKVFIHSNGSFGIFERDKAPVYYLNAVNVSRLDVDFAKLTLSEFLALRKRQDSDYDARPSLSQHEGYQHWSFPPPKNVQDEWEAIPFDVNEKTGKALNLSSGIYALSLRAPEYVRTWGDKKQIVNYQYFALTNIGLTLKYSGTKALVWAVDLRTGEVLADVDISFHSLGKENIYTGKTDRNGFFETEIDLKKFIATSDTYRPEFWVTANYKDDFAFLENDWSGGIQPYNFGFSSDFHDANDPEYRMESYLYTERPVYRPGDTVHFKGILRLRDSQGDLYPPKKSRKAVVKIMDSKENKVYDKTLELTEFGSFSDEIPLDSEAALGDYRLSVELTPGDDIARSYKRLNFSVLAYRKPEYRVEVSSLVSNSFHGETLRINTEGSYYFGGPLSDAKISLRAKTTDYFFNRYTEDWYSFALEDAWCYWDCERETSLLATENGTLDETGNFVWELPVDISEKSVSQVVTIEADVMDPNNQMVSNRVSVPVHRSEVYVGIKSETYSAQPGEAATFKLITLTPEGDPVSGQKVQVKLFSRTWNTLRKKNVDGLYYYDNEAKDTLISETDVTSSKKGIRVAKITIPKGGQYRVVASTKDKKGRESKAGTSVYAWSSTYVNWPRKNDDKMDIVADKPEYSVGDTAKLLVKSPYQGKGVKAMITVEQENVMRKKIIDITSNAQSFAIPITEEMIPNAYVSVVVMKPRQGETFNDHGLDTGIPAFKIGYTKLLVETSTKKIDVSLTTDKKKYGPGETVKVKLKAIDHKGNPVVSELSLSVVDMSVLALTGFQMPDVVKRFYSERGLGVLTSELLTYMMERFKPGSKGGGGADPETKKRGNFRDTAYWNPVMHTNARGEATVEFSLPDNLTTWKLLAIAQTKKNTFGAVAEEIVETKRVILRPVRPRFAVRGDTIQLGAIVHNFLDTDAEFKVTLTGSGFTALGDSEQTVEVLADGKEKIYFPVKVNKVDTLTLNLLAQTEGARDEIEETLPIHVFGTPQSVATSGMTETMVTEILAIPTEEDAASGEVSVTVSPTLATYLPEGLEYLVKFPYGCAEQTVSSFLPNVAIQQLQGFDAFTVVDDKQLEKNILGGLERLYTFQRGDGGFGYWAGSRKSYSYLTAYILLALHETNDSGHAVDEGVMSRAREYLKSELRKNDEKNPLTGATRAYILFVLAEGGDIDIGLLNNLYDKRKNNLPLFSQAHLAMALKKAGTETSTKKARTMLDEIMMLAKTETRGVHFEERKSNSYRSLMHTNTRSTATILQALVRIQSENSLIPRVVRYLLAVREQGHWDTTQSTTISLLALIEFLKQTGELDANMVATVQWGEKNILNKTFDQENVLAREEAVLAFQDLARGTEESLVFETQGKGRLYYDVLMSYFYTADILPPAEEGFGILRELFPLKSEKNAEGLTDAMIGETYKAKLTITVPEDRHFVAVESPLPAGMEAIDTRLKTSQQTVDNLISSCEDRWTHQCWKNNLWRFNHTELRDDRVFLFADFLPAGVYEYEYLVRATTPGKFKLRPARVWEMYFPETFGQTDGGWFEVRGDD